MCGSKMKTDGSNPPKPSSRRNPSGTGKLSSSRSSSLDPNSNRFAKPSAADPSTSYEHYTNTGSNYTTSSINSVSSRNSLLSLRESLPENAHIYDLSEICTATNNFLAKRFSSSSSSSAWRCHLRGKDVIVFQRKLHRLIETSQLRQGISFVCKSHHMSLIKLFGASVSGDHIYLVYDFVNGANLTDCLRNPKNSSFTVLSNWSARMQIATDLAQGLEYIHHYTGNGGHVHNHIKSSSLIITEPSFNAKICHFGTAQLCGEITTDHSREISKFKRSDTRNMKFQGTRGYMSPEYQSSGIATQKSDVFAFGVVILELLSGEEPLKYKLDKEMGDYRRVSVIETAAQCIESPGRLRRWMDTRLKDSFPLEVAEKVTRVALDCVHIDPDKRPDMRRVAGKMSNYYLNSIKWAESVKLPTDISISLGPR